MSKYIDADRLKAEIEKPKNELKVGNYYLDNSEQAVGYENALMDFELLIDSLQQVQPEVDLDREITHIWGKCATEPKDQIACLHIESFIEIARHFYELGKNSK